MFDIGFAELVIIAVVSLLVIGPERLPGAIRTVSVWLGRFKRSFNEIRQEVEQELHNDAVMQELRKTSEQIKQESTRVRSDLERAAGSIDPLAVPPTQDPAAAPESAADAPADKP